MVGFHCTTKRKLLRYIQTGCILPPVRFWSNIHSAKAWMQRVKRDTLLKIEVSDDKSYPLPDHKPRGTAYWADEMVRVFEKVEEVTPR